MNSYLLHRFDMKLFAVTTPMGLEMVFNWHFMKNYLGVEQLEDGRHGASVKLDNGTVGVLCTSIKDTFGTHDTSRLVKISPDQVHIVFGNMPKERD